MPPVDKPQLAAIPQALTLPCDAPVALPERALTSTETVRLWARDRQSLGVCRLRHGALARATTILEGQGR